MTSRLTAEAEADKCPVCGTRYLAILPPNTVFCTDPGCGWSGAYRTSAHVAQFDAALAKVTQERGAHYDHPAHNFRRAQLMKAVVRDCPHQQIREALEMVVVKVARLVYDPSHMDSVVDIAGYARTIAMILDYEEERSDAS